MAKDELPPEQALEAALADLEAANTALADAKRRVDDAQAVVDAAIEAAEVNGEPHADQVARMSYIASQQEARAARYGVIEKVLGGAKIEAADLDPRSPLDRAMRRNKSRGQARPQKAA